MSESHDAMMRHARADARLTDADLASRMSSEIDAWHFVGITLRDGRHVPADGVTLCHDGPLVPCEQGLHGSERIIDALGYATADTICKVRLGGTVIRDLDMITATRRTILWCVDVETELRAFARWCALQVLPLWDAPDVMRLYLETGDETLRADAFTEALEAEGVIWPASDASDAAWKAAKPAGWANRAAIDASKPTGVATWPFAAAAWNAQHAAQAARNAAAGRAGTWGARNAGWSALDAQSVQSAQNAKLTEMVLAAHESQKAETAEGE